MPKAASLPALRLLVYDDTCRGRDGGWPLTYSWMAGHALYRARGCLDKAYGARSWQAALTWLADMEPDRPIAEIQFWGHGKWGEARIGSDVLNTLVLDPSHPWRELLHTIRARLHGPEALWWFRTCETFGAQAGQDFARRWANFMQCRVAGHTHIIGPWQSGLHSLRPGEQPSWSAEEGLAAGSTAQAPKQALWSSRKRPHTISCLHSRIPAGY